VLWKDLGRVREMRGLLVGRWIEEILVEVEDGKTSLFWRDI
jgi:hypothetical protein